jgi:hypothetical protein
MTRAVILSCSQRKNDCPALLPAIERYDGPLFRVLRRHAKQAPSDTLRVLIVSSEFGLIASDTLITRYDRVMTDDRALVLRSQLPAVFRIAASAEPLNEVFVSLSGPYLKALEPCWDSLPADISISFAQGSIGGRASQMTRWLESGSPGHEVPIDAVGEATLLGTTIRLTREEVLIRAKEFQAADPEGAQRFQTWCIEVGADRVAPKWLVSLLFDKPVATFRTADARRLLSLLGVNCVYANHH